MQHVLAIVAEGQAGKDAEELLAVEDLEFVLYDLVEVDDVRWTAVFNGAERGVVNRVLIEFLVQVG